MQLRFSGSHRDLFLLFLKSCTVSCGGPLQSWLMLSGEAWWDSGRAQGFVTGSAVPGRQGCGLEILGFSPVYRLPWLSGGWAWGTGAWEQGLCCSRQRL